MHDNRRVGASIRYSTATGAPRLRMLGTDFDVLPTFVAMISPDVLGTPNTVEITVRFLQRSERWEVWSLGVLREDGEPPIAPEALRAIAPTEALRTALQGRPDIVMHQSGATAWDIWKEDGPILARRRSDGPTAENLAAVADAYRVARVLRVPPVAKVAELFGLPQRTATHWVKLARERGHLDQGLDDGATTDAD